MNFKTLEILGLFEFSGVWESGAKGSSRVFFIHAGLGLV